MRQFQDAYREMAEKARYRPEAPSDGLGNITASVNDSDDLEVEAHRYAERFRDEEGKRKFGIGCTNHRTAKATVFLIEAARTLCGGQDDLASELVKLAWMELRYEQGDRTPSWIGLVSVRSDTDHPNLDDAYISGDPVDIGQAIAQALSDSACARFRLDVTRNVDGVEARR